VFTNTTGKQLQSWTWYFGDPTNKTLFTDKDTTVTFTYNAGVYEIGLLGAEDIFNPGTGNTFTCLSFFPDTVFNIPSRRIVVFGTPELEIKSKDRICPNEPLELTASGDTIYSKFNWDFGDGMFDSISRPDTIVSHTFLNSGSYQVKLIPVHSLGYQCVDTATKTIVASQVKADFDIDESQAPKYTFTNTSEFSVRYLWDFGKPSAGSSNQSTESDPIFNYGGDSGTFTICLMAFNSEDCWDSICKQTKPTARITIPNVFTPGNNDGKNDAFDIDIMGYQTYKLTIYNRWGARVFEGDKDGIGNDGQNWNGLTNNTGAVCPGGTYYYIFTYKLVTEAAEKTVHGTITLIRDK
jgi:gliding motility-associated-like protein